MIKTLLLIIGGLLAAILALLFMALIMPSSVKLYAAQEKFFLWIKIGPIRLQLYPKKEKKRRGKQQNIYRETGENNKNPAEKQEACVPSGQENMPQSSKKASPAAPKLSKESARPEKGSPSKFSWLTHLEPSKWMEYLRFAVEAMGELRRRIVISKLQLHFVVATEDAAKTALLFGASAAAVNMGLPWLEEQIRISKKDISVDADFQQTTPQAEIEIAFSAILLRLLIAGIRIFKKFIKLQEKNNKKAV